MTPYDNREDIKQEMDWINSDQFVLGEHIYMAMGQVGEHKVCIGVAYKVDYCIKKALQFVEVDPNVTFTHIRKIKIGDTHSCQKFYF